MILTDKPNYVIEHTGRGIYFVVPRGKFTAATLDEFRADSWPHLERLAPVLYMNDVSQIGDASLSDQWMLAKLMRAQAHLIKRSAVYGVSPAKRIILGAVLRAAGRDNVRVVEGREQAERYLLEGDGAASP